MFPKHEESLYLKDFPGCLELYLLAAISYITPLSSVAIQRQDFHYAARKNIADQH
jgi:hypothetical protein